MADPLIKIGSFDFKGLKLKDCSVSSAPLYAFVALCVLLVLSLTGHLDALSGIVGSGSLAAIGKRLYGLLPK
jgi:hypothetical protein